MTIHESFYGLGQVIAPDPGTANDGVRFQAGWYHTTLAHNTLVVEEISQRPPDKLLLLLPVKCAPGT